jgi:hypothetical protein
LSPCSRFAAGQHFGITRAKPRGSQTLRDLSRAADVPVSRPARSPFFARQRHAELIFDRLDVIYTRVS